MGGACRGVVARLFVAKRHVVPMRARRCAPHTNGVVERGIETLMPRWVRCVVWVSLVAVLAAGCVSSGGSGGSLVVDGPGGPSAGAVQAGEAGAGGAAGAGVDGVLVLVGAGVDWLSVRWGGGFAPDAAEFRLRWREVPAGDDEVVWSSVDLGAAVRDHRIGGLVPGTPYRLRLNALDADGALGALAVATFETLAPPARGLAAAPATEDGVRLSWDAPEGWVPVGYVLRWRLRSVEAFAGEVSLPASARSHVVSGLSDAVEYVFRVNPLSASGREGDPAKVGATTAAGGLLLLTGAGVDWLSVRWAERFAPDAAGFRLRWRVVPAGEDGVVWSSVDLGASVREYRIGGLAPGTRYRLRLGVLDGDGALGAEVSGSFGTLPPPPSCADGAVGDAAADAALLVECNVQAGLVDALVGAGEATLNWDPATDISMWDGVTVEGSPRRVVKLDLANMGLAGELPARLVNLEELRELRVDGNSLGGRIPSELGLLRKLTHLYVAGNNFTGCYPPHWDDVANNDLAELGLPSCAIPYDLLITTGVTAAGSYALLSDADDPTSLFEPEHTMGEAEAVLVHDTDANGVSAAAFYNTIRPGDVFDLSEGTLGVGCFRRFEVTEVVLEPAGAAGRTLFKIDHRGSTVWDCDHSSLYNTPQPAKLYWHPVPWVWGPDDIRDYVAEPVTGPGRYWVTNSVTIQVPDGVTLEVEGEVYYDATWRQGVRDVASGARLGFDSWTGENVGREIPEGLSDAQKAAINALFDELEASIETPRQRN